MATDADVRAALSFDFSALPIGEAIATVHSQCVADFGVGNRQCLFVATASNRIYYLVRQGPATKRNSDTATKAKLGKAPNEATSIRPATSLHLRFRQLQFQFPKRKRPASEADNSNGDIVSIAVIPHPLEPLNNTQSLLPSAAAVSRKKKKKSRQPHRRNGASSRTKAQFLRDANIKTANYLSNQRARAGHDISIVVCCATSPKSESSGVGNATSTNQDPGAVDNAAPETAITSTGRLIPTTTSSNVKSEDDDDTVTTSQSSGRQQRGTVLVYTSQLVTIADEVEANHMRNQQRAVGVRDHGVHGRLSHCRLHHRVELSFAPYQCKPCPAFVAHVGVEHANSVPSSNAVVPFGGDSTASLQSYVRRTVTPSTESIADRGSFCVCGSDGQVHFFGFKHGQTEPPRLSGVATGDQSAFDGATLNFDKKVAPGCKEVTNVLCPFSPVENDAPISLSMAACRCSPKPPQQSAAGDSVIETTTVLGFRSGRVACHRLRCRGVAKFASITRSRVGQGHWKFCEGVEHEISSFPCFVDGPAVSASVVARPATQFGFPSTQQDIVVGSAIGQVLVHSTTKAAHAVNANAVPADKPDFSLAAHSFVQRGEIVSCVLNHPLVLTDGTVQHLLFVGTLDGRLYVIKLNCVVRNGSDVSREHRCVHVHKFSEPVMGLHSVDFAGGGSLEELVVCTSTGVYVTRYDAPVLLSCCEPASFLTFV